MCYLGYTFSFCSGSLFISLCVRSFIHGCVRSRTQRGLFRCSAQTLVVVCGLSSAAHRLRCPAACEILVPRLGIEPMSPALQGGFLTTGPPGKSLGYIFKKKKKLLLKAQNHYCTAPSVTCFFSYSMFLGYLCVSVCSCDSFACNFLSLLLSVIPRMISCFLLF